MAAQAQISRSTHDNARCASARIISTIASNVPLRLAGSGRTAVMRSAETRPRRAQPDGLATIRGAVAFLEGLNGRDLGALP